MRFRLYYCSDVNVRQEKDDVGQLFGCCSCHEAASEWYEIVWRHVGCSCCVSVSERSKGLLFWKLSSFQLPERNKSRAPTKTCCKSSLVLSVLHLINPFLTIFTSNTVQVSQPIVSFTRVVNEPCPDRWRQLKTDIQLSTCEL